MNKKFITVALLLLSAAAPHTLRAQVELVNPVPQKVEIPSQNSLFAIPEKWALVCDESRASGFIYETLNTASPEVDKKQDFKVIFGTRSDKADRKSTRLNSSHT